MKRQSSATGPPRFVVGIDLGTTNSVVAFADTHDGEVPSLRVLDIPQLAASGAVEAHALLPSFLYLPAPDEFPRNALQLPWAASPELIVGELAQRRGAEVPARVVASAKSWLSYAGADRSAPILPWNSPDDVRKLSPVEVSTQYLAHIRHAWNAAFADAPLEAQDVFLTVPASFDAVARDLTVRAAHEAGLPQVTILEEPQAAFYAWIDANGTANGAGWRTAVHVGDVVLVCDIGGGTTDFTLIAVREENGELVLDRVAVGDHILLGGDNMDLALAYAVRERLAQAKTTLDQWQFRGLSMSCRDAKERLLSDAKVAKHAIAILGRGRKVVGGTLRTDVVRSDVDLTLLDGFFPQCQLSDAPQAQRRSALQEIGLPYATDPAVTRHLAAFLRRHGAAAAAGAETPRAEAPRAASTAAHPTAVLFNGGVMRAGVLRERLVDVVNGWFAPAAGMRVLGGGNPEHAVARGAAYYGLARRGRGVRIRGGTARAYYIGIESAMPAVPGVRPPLKALCVVPRGIEEGSDIDLPAQEFALVVGEPTEFRFLSSATRRDDHVGSLIESWDDDLAELAPLVTTLEWSGQEGEAGPRAVGSARPLPVGSLDSAVANLDSGGTASQSQAPSVPVRLQARVTELGVLELWCVSRDGAQRWKLEFNVRGQGAAA